MATEASNIGRDCPDDPQSTQPTPATQPMARRIRVMMQQPALPKYQVPSLRELARRPNIDLTVVYSSLPNISNVPPVGFKGVLQEMKRFTILNHEFWWHQAQWSLADPETTDVLILCWNVHYLSLIPALLHARIRGVPTILWGHGVSKWDHRLRALPRELVARLANALVFYSPSVAQNYLDRGWNPEKIFVAINSLDQDSIQAARRNWLARPADLHAFQVQNDLVQGPVLLFVSRLEPANRVEWLLQAVSQLVVKWPHLKLVIVGKGQDEPRLRTISSELGISERVRFAGAIYDEDQLAPWFLSSQLFCYPTNMGLSLLHAFGYGLPVVTSDRLQEHGPEIEALAPGVNGLLYEHGNPDSFAKAIVSLLEDPGRRQAMSAAADRTASEVYSTSKMVDGFEAAIRYCVTSR